MKKIRPPKFTDSWQPGAILSAALTVAIFMGVAAIVLITMVM